MSDFERVKKAYEELGGDVELYGFSDDMASLMNRADLAVSRAGASTLWELTANGLVGFFIPYPYAAGDHQYFNAKFILDHNMGWCYRESEDLEGKLLEILDENLHSKSEKLLSYTQKDVASSMIKAMQESLK